MRTKLIWESWESISPIKICYFFTEKVLLLQKQKILLMFLKYLVLFNKKILLSEKKYKYKVTPFFRKVTLFCVKSNTFLWVFLRIFLKLTLICLKVSSFFFQKKATLFYVKVTYLVKNNTFLSDTLVSRFSYKVGSHLNFSLYIYIYIGLSSNENQAYMRTVRTNLSGKNVLLSHRKGVTFAQKNVTFVFTKI